MNNDCSKRSHSCLQPTPIYLIKIIIEMQGSRAINLHYGQIQRRKDMLLTEL